MIESLVLLSSPYRNSGPFEPFEQIQPDGRFRCEADHERAPGVRPVMPHSGHNGFGRYRHSRPAERPAVKAASGQRASPSARSH
jgi:hypothetical protein